MLAILDTYNNKINGLDNKVICPYTVALKGFVKHVQQIEMESLGKNYNIEENRQLNKDELVA